MFKPVESVRLSDAAVDQILAVIGAGDLQVGDRIPSERELMRQLGVGRASVREALRTLETMGVIDVRPGQGAVIVNTLTNAPASQLWKSWLSSHQEETLQLLDVREALETKAAALAAQHATREQLTMLHEAIARLESTIPEGDPAVRAEADVAFHETLARSSNNRFLIALAESLMYAMHEARVGAYIDPDRARLSLQEHTAILEAVAACSPERAMHTMAIHLSTSKEYLRHNPRNGHST